MSKSKVFPAWPVKTDNPSAGGWRNLFNIQLIETLLRDAARCGKALSYAETLNQLGYDFSRPKMRALCVALGEVDARARTCGEPPLAVLVVRASDSIPGIGWWIDKDRRQYKGPTEGAAALAYIRRKQKLAFRYWQQKSPRPKRRGLD